MPLNSNPFEGPASPSSDEEQPRPPLVNVVIGLAVVVNLGATLPWLSLLRLPVGSSVRPMVASGTSAMFSIVGLLVAAPLCILAIRNHKNHRVTACIALVFSLLSFPLGSIALQCVASLRGLTLLE